MVGGGLNNEYLTKITQNILKCSESLRTFVKVNIAIVIIIGLRSVSASKDVIGDPSRPGTNNSELLEPRREEREKVLG